MLGTIHLRRQQIFPIFDFWERILPFRWQFFTTSSGKFDL